MDALVMNHVRRTTRRQSVSPRIVAAVIVLAFALPCNAQQQRPSGVTSSRQTASPSAGSPTPDGAATVGLGAILFS